MKIAICDDVKEYRLSIKAYTNAFFEQKHLECSVDEYNNGNDLINNKTKYDIVFLDIELGDSNGIDIAKQLIGKNKNTVILIATSYNQYLDAAMDLHVVRFINKPITKDKIFSSLTKALNVIDESIISVRLINNQIVRLKITEIIYVEAKLKKVVIYTTSNVYTSKETLKNLKPILSASFFAIPHNSFIVNLNYIRDFKREEITLSYPYNDTRIPIASRKQPIFKRIFLDFIGEGNNE